MSTIEINATEGKKMKMEEVEKEVVNQHVMVSNIKMLCVGGHKMFSL